MLQLFPPLLTVSELTRQIRSHLEQQFPSVWVEGEVSNLRCPSSGHQYLTLKDSSSQIRAVLFRGQAQRLKFALQDGLEVFVRGRLTVYEPRGEYQLLLEAVEPKGIGELELAFRQLKAKLEKEGLFQESRKRPLPSFPERIGIITSPVGAALHDLLTILHRRWPLAQVLIMPVAVQGEAAAGQIAEAIQMVNHVRLQSESVDLLIVGRGGGSLEDLWAFNEEQVVRAIVASRVPVVSAIGHETDVTLSDFVADCRAPTPSAAAELVAPDWLIVKEQLVHHRSGMERAFKSMVAVLTIQVQQLGQRLPDPRLILSRFIQRVDDLERQLYRKVKDWCRKVQLVLIQHQSAMWETSPLLKIRQEQGHVTELKEHLIRNLHNMVLSQRQEVQLAVSQLHQLSPLAVLARGYSIVKDLRDGKVLKKSTDTTVGSRIHMRLSEGELVCKVEQIHAPK